MGKLFMLILICAGVGSVVNPVVGAVLFLGGLMGVGLVAILK